MGRTLPINFYSFIATTMDLNRKLIAVFDHLLQNAISEWRGFNVHDYRFHSCIKILADVLQIVKKMLIRGSNLALIVDHYQLSLTNCDQLMNLFGFIRTLKDLQPYVSLLTLASYVESFSNIHVNSFWLRGSGQNVKAEISRSKPHWTAIIKALHLILRFFSEVLGDICYFSGLEKQSKQFWWHQVLRIISLLSMICLNLGMFITNGKLGKKTVECDVRYASTGKHHPVSSIKESRKVSPHSEKLRSYLLSLIRDLLFLLCSTCDIVSSWLHVTTLTFANLAANIIAIKHDDTAH